jgi:hypothetical protein
MEVSYDRFVYYRPALGSMAPSPNEDEEKALKYFRLTLQAAKALAPYQSPKIRAIRLAPAPEQQKDLPPLTLRLFDERRHVGPKRGNEDNPDGLDGSSTTH